MNTKGNQRFVQTRQKIKGVFLELLREKKIGEITVSEICRRADIHRTTFYGHFDDVYDLMQNMVEEMYVQLMDFLLWMIRSGCRRDSFSFFNLSGSTGNFSAAIWKATASSGFPFR